MVDTRPLSTEYDGPAITAVGTSFSMAKKALLTLPSNPRENFRSRLGALWVSISSIVTAVDLTMIITTDVAGDAILIPTTTSTFDSNVTTAASGMAVYYINIPVDLPSELIYVVAKTNAGTVTIDSVKLTWEY